jgi:uncharacterized protein YcfL
MNTKIVFSALALSALVGCASIIDGTSQEIVINTTPDKASCKLLREGSPIGEVSSTPGAVTIKKTKHDITIECEKEGFYKSTYYDKSGIQDATWGNIVLGGGIGWAIDSASGSDNKYTSPLNISMVPLVAGRANPRLAKRSRLARLNSEVGRKGNGSSASICLFVRRTQQTHVEREQKSSQLLPKLLQDRQ